MSAIKGVGDEWEGAYQHALQQVQSEKAHKLSTNRLAAGAFNILLALLCVTVCTVLLMLTSLWMLALTFFLLGLWWTYRWLKLGKDQVLAIQAPQANNEVSWANIRERSATLPPAARTIFLSTWQSVYQALELTHAEPTLSRDRHDAQQAAEVDMPELLRIYQGARSKHSKRPDIELLQQLYTIRQRMHHIISRKQQEAQQALEAHGRYLQTKYPVDR